MCNSVQSNLPNVLHSTTIDHRLSPIEQDTYACPPLSFTNKQDAESSAKTAADRDQEIATGNPLLNLQNALGQSPAPGTPASSSASTSFSVKRRWDDDLIFKNQAAGLDDKPKKGEFVNDLLRSEFHKKFMLK
jgi:protein CWC15